MFPSSPAGTPEAQCGPDATMALAWGSELAVTRTVSKTVNPGSNPGSPAEQATILVTVLPCGS